MPSLRNSSAKQMNHSNKKQVPVPNLCRKPAVKHFPTPACLILCMMILIPALVKADPLRNKNMPGPETPWHITAQKITYNQRTNVYTAFGDVKIIKDDKALSADTIVYDQATMEAAASGNVRLTAGRDTLLGDTIHINLETGIGAIENGRIFIEKSHFYVQGDRILKTGENSYTIENGSLTTCDGDVPPWRITGEKVDLTIESYGTVRHAALWAKKLPVFYVPFLIFPVNIKRQTGLLPPQLGYSSRNGIEFIQPFYWAINQSSDATFYYHHLQERGEKFGAEYRYAIDDQSKGTMMMDSLEDRHIDDGEGDTSDDWGYTDDPYLRRNADRYWFRMKADQQMPYDFDARMDADIVSDQDYLDEFSSRHTGYDETRDYFESEFGRDLDDPNDYVRENSLILSKVWTQYSFNAEMLWYDHVVNRRLGDDDPTLQQLPVMTFNALKQPIFKNRLFLGMDSEFSNFYRRDGETGQRMDIHPRMYLPLHYKNYFTFEPSAGFRQTDWYLDRMDEDVAAVTDEYKFMNRELYDLQAELSTDLFSVYPVGAGSIKKIKHTIIPMLEYSYIPDLDQAENPDFDDTDQILPENCLTFSLTNLLISRNRPPETGDTSLSPAIEGNATGPGISPPETSQKDTYNQFLWFKIAQSYDFILGNTPDEQPFLPLYAELILTPVRLLTLHADTEWDHESGIFTTANTYVRINTPRNDRLTVEYRYTRDASESIYLDASTAITDAVSIFGNYERNLKEAEDIETGLGFRYQAQCWGYEVYYQHEDDDQKFGFMISLTGLGDMGSGL